MTTQGDYVDPTGTYELDNKTRKKGEDVYGYFGQMQVKKLETYKTVVTFFICKGAPSYNSGSFVDTLDYNYNTAIYTDPESDPSCKLTLAFYYNGVMTIQESNDYNFGCGFGHGVEANGQFKRVSSEVPVLKKPGTDEILK